MGLKIFAPATIANLSIGLDVLAVALEAPGDYVIVKKSDKKGLKISSIKGNNKLPLDIDNNAAGYAAYKLLEHMGEQDHPIDFELHKKTPVGMGLGSSAASAVAGVMAINEYFDCKLEKRDLLPFAIMGQQKVSGTRSINSVVASLFGGINLIGEGFNQDFSRIHTPRCLVFLVIKLRLRTIVHTPSDKMNNTVSMPKLIAQTSNIAGFVTGCFTSNFDLIQRSMEDHILEQQQSHNIPLYDEMKSLALNHGALGFNISGKGPVMFALCHNTRILEDIKESASRLYADNKFTAKFYTSEINGEGAYRC